MMEIPLDISSMSTTSSWSRFSCWRRYSRSPFSSALIGSSSPVEVMTEIFMRVSTRLFRLMYSSRSMSGQKFTSWITSVPATDAVDPAKPLDDPHRVPVDVVVDEVVAVLEVLALGDTVRGDQDVQVPPCCSASECPGPSKRGRKQVSTVFKSARRRGIVVFPSTVPVISAVFRPKFCFTNGATCSVEIVRRVGKGRER